MRIEYLCRQEGGKVPCIDTAIFRLKDGTEVEIDRDRTDYEYNDTDRKGHLEMAWIDCYIWDGYEQNYLKPGDLDGAVFESFVIEDDARVTCSSTSL